MINRLATRRKAAVVLIVVLAGALTAACGVSPLPAPTSTVHASSNVMSPSSSQSSSVPSAADTMLPEPTVLQPWTDGVLDRAYEVPVSVLPGAVLQTVRWAQHDGYDRFVFEFDRPVPSVHAEYVTEVIQDPSGRPVAFPDGAKAFLVIRFDQANAHTPDGVVKPPVSGEPNLPAIKAFRLVGDFEAVTTMAFGLPSRRGFQVGPQAGAITNKVWVDVAH